MKKFILPILAIFLLSACSKSGDDNPQSKAIFKVENEAFLNQELNFVNTSENAVTYEWNFGDGTTSKEKEPKHKYAKAGDYTITLKTNGNSEVTGKVKVYDATHGFVVKNDTENTFQLTLFDRVDENTVGSERFVIEELKPGATSKAFFTNKINISFGGYVNGWSFVSLTPRMHIMQAGKLNTITINGDVKLTLGLEVPK